MNKTQSVREVQSEIRDLINWVKIFEDEYNLDKEVVETLCSRLEKLSKAVTNLVE